MDAFAETVRDMKNLTSDLYSAHKSTPGSGNETVVSIVYLIVIFGGETSLLENINQISKSNKPLECFKVIMNADYVKINS